MNKLKTNELQFVKNFKSFLNVCYNYCVILVKQLFGEKIMFTGSNKGVSNPRKDKEALVIAAKYDISQGYGRMWDGTDEQRKAQSALQAEQEVAQKQATKIMVPSSLFELTVK